MEDCIISCHKEKVPATKMNSSSDDEIIPPTRMNLCPKKLFFSIGIFVLSKKRISGYRDEFIVRGRNNMAE